MLGRKITHKRLSREEFKRVWLGYGLSEDYAEIMTQADLAIAEGAEEKTFALEEKYVGRRRFREFLETNKGIWKKPE